MKQNINFKVVDSRLLEVRFKALTPIDGRLSMKIDDLIEPTDIRDDGFTLTFSRHVHLEPESMFDILVSFEVRCVFDDAAKSFFKSRTNDIQPFIEKSKDTIIRKKNIGNQASLLIGQLTSYQGMNPVILPPYKETIKHKPS